MDEASLLPQQMPYSLGTSPAAATSPFPSAINPHIQLAMQKVLQNANGTMQSPQQDQHSYLSHTGSGLINPSNVYATHKDPDLNQLLASLQLGKPY